MSEMKASLLVTCFCCSCTLILGLHSTYLFSAFPWTNAEDRLKTTILKQRRRSVIGNWRSELHQRSGGKVSSLKLRRWTAHPTNLLYPTTSRNRAADPKGLVQEVGGFHSPDSHWCYTGCHFVQRGKGCQTEGTTVSCTYTKPGVNSLLA